MAYAAITSFMATLYLSLGHQSLRASADEKEIMEVLYGKLDSLRTFVEETEKIIRDHETLKTLEAITIKVAYTAEDMVDSALGELVYSETDQTKEEAKAALTSLEMESEENQESMNAAITSLEVELERYQQYHLWMKRKESTNGVYHSLLTEFKESQLEAYQQYHLLMKPEESIIAAFLSLLVNFKESQGRPYSVIFSFLEATITSLLTELKESQQRTIAAKTSLLRNSECLTDIFA